MLDIPDLTKNQSLVFEALSCAEAPLSAYSLLARLRQEGLRAPLQVYRALDKLIARGLVHRLESLNAFVVCSHRHGPSDQSTGFAICDECGQVAEFAQPAIGRGLSRWARETSFSPRTVTVELHGLCRDCQSKAR